MISFSCPFTSGLQKKKWQGRIEQMIGFILLALAISHIEMMFPRLFSGAISPRFFATSLVPASMTTYL